MKKRLLICEMAEKCDHRDCKHGVPHYELNNTCYIGTCNGHLPNRYDREVPVACVVTYDMKKEIEEAKLGDELFEI